MSEERQTASWAGFLRHRPGDVFVAQLPAGIVGFGNCGPQRDGSFGYAGEVYTLYVTPDSQGLGFGRQLLLALFARLLHCGHRSALVWVATKSRSSTSLVRDRKLGSESIYAASYVASAAYKLP